MSKLMKYKGYEGSAEISFEDKVLYGKILHIRDLIMYEGGSIEAIQEAFEAAVDDYLEDCRLEGMGVLEVVAGSPASLPPQAGR